MTQRVYQTRTDSPERLSRMYMLIETIISHMINTPEEWKPQGDLSTASTVCFNDIVICIDGSIHMPVMMKPDERQEELLGGMASIMIQHARDQKTNAVLTTKPNLA